MTGGSGGGTGAGVAGQAGAVAYRPATPADVPSLHATWAASFAEEHVVGLWSGDPGRFGRTFVAVGAELGVLAAVYWLPRRVRDATGGVDLVGGLANVATRPSARGRGHVRRLLDLALAAMAADGCAWSLLFTGTPGVYASSGFRTFSLSYPAGLPAHPGVPPAGWTVSPESLAGWPELAGVHAEFDARRPLSTVRDADDWRRRVPVFYAPPAELLVARRGAELGGYLVAQWWADRVRVVEAAVRPGRTDALRALFGAVARAAGARGVRHCEARLPADPAVEAALPCLLRAPVTEVDSTGMVRPVLATADHLAAITGAPGAFHWPGDYL